MGRTGLMNQTLVPRKNNVPVKMSQPLNSDILTFIIGDYFVIRHFSRSSISRAFAAAFPRWLTASFCSGVNSAIVLSNSGR